MDGSLGALWQLAGPLTGAVLGLAAGWLGARTRLDAQDRATQELRRDLVEVKGNVVWEKTCGQCRQNVANQMRAVSENLQEVKEGLRDLTKEMGTLPAKLARTMSDR